MMNEGQKEIMVDDALSLPLFFNRSAAIPPVKDGVPRVLVIVFGLDLGVVELVLP